MARCGQCHAPFSPRHASADEWPTFVRKYGPRAGLFGEDSEIGTAGARISHGCIRLHDQALEELAKVPPGTPIDVVG